MLRSDLIKQPAVKSKTRTPSTKPLESVVDISSPLCASNESSYLKENINVNTPETSKLNVEPLQMKRKKKGGEHNLRKSLAWDRAFFTEEGVLNPQELSIISGVSYREGLSVINNGTPCSSPLTIKPADRQKSKYNSSKEFQDADLSKDRRKSILSSKLYSSSSNIMNSNKVSTWVGSQSRTRSGGCPVPLPPSSLKRPANVNTTRAAPKEVKLPKIPGLSTGGPSPVRITSESNTPKVNCVNHNQVVQSDFSILRNAGLRSFSKSLKTPQSASKVNSVQSARQLERNSSHSSFKGLSSVNMSAVLAENSDIISVPKIVIGNITPSRPVNSSEEQCKTITPAALFAQNSHESGRRLPPSQDQSMKPTGLRMPSPSLSFFSQPKASVLQNLSMRDIDMDICGSQKSRDLKLQETLRRSPQKERNMPISISSSTIDISTRSCSLQPFHVNDSSHKLDLDSNSTEMVARKVLYDAFAFDPISCKLDEDCIVDGQVQDLSTKIGQEVAETQKVDDEMPSQSGNYEHRIDDRKLKTTISPIKINAIDEPCKQLDKCNFDLSDNPANKRLSKNLYQETLKLEIDYRNSFLKSRMCEVSQNNVLRNVTDAVPVVEDNSGNNCGTSTMLVKGDGCDMDNQRSEADSRIVLAKSPRLNACFVKQSECLELPNAGIEAENLCQSNDGLRFGNISQRKNTVLKESSDENEFGSMVDSFTVHKKCLDFLRKSSSAVQESSLKHDSCSTAKESDVSSYIADAVPVVADASRTKPFPNPNESEVCQETSTSFNRPFPKLDNDQVKDALTPNNINGNGLNEKSRTLLLPQNAVPFSDEWLSAIEAAGEDILTRKGGAVQNSPTDKSVPEPSPWSPVKRKNNAIGPFDCTKCTNFQPSESN